MKKSQEKFKGVSQINCLRYDTATKIDRIIGNYKIISFYNTI